ncbi:MAG: 2-dehydropantoate 2-reductase [Candidatus Thermoplasmatota archaeon]|jgi:2-dehydropantoate 2-reductase|nr:2-dehydropantoate 2-reductase [Candidatus Thermoplasmatota archaeon]
MNIVILGAGAIGSLFGGLLAKKNNVTLIGRKQHVQAIKKNGLKITGKTQLKIRISAEDSINKIRFSPDLLILTVKSYDTETAIKEAKTIIGKDTIVLSLQNGLDNIEKICRIIDKRNVVAGVTTHGVLFSKPGLINHTGKGTTILGELNGKKTERIISIVSCFNQAGIKTVFSKNILKEIWCKTIINSCVNPLTAIFECKNGYLLENPILEDLVEKICKESVGIANANGVNISYESIIEKTKDVIRKTSENYSSMFQSYRKNSKTEIYSINGKIADLGRTLGLDVSLNEMLIYLIRSMCKK